MKAVIDGADYIEVGFEDASVAVYVVDGQLRVEVWKDGKKATIYRFDHDADGNTSLEVV